MFKGIGAMEPFSFTFSNGVVTGPNYSFDLKSIIPTMTEAEKSFYRASPSMLIHFVYENWNKTFNSACIKSGGNLNLGVEWDSGCLIASGTPNLLNAAGQEILTAVGAWGAGYLGQTPAPTPTSTPTPTPTPVPFPWPTPTPTPTPIPGDGTPTPDGNTNESGFAGNIKMLAIVGAVALGLLLLVKR